MLRELAGYDPDRLRVVFQWPLREALLCYVQLLKAAAMTEYRHQVMLWAALAPHGKEKRKPPRPPLILRSPNRIRDGRGE
jgi:hypothetical protein